MNNLPPNKLANRIKKEVMKLSQEADPKLYNNSLSFKDDNYSEVVGKITGPMDTPYEGGIFELQVTIPSTYPFKPPSVRFVTKVWHPNISSATGTICLDILTSKWDVQISLITILSSLQALLSSPEPSNPQDAVVANQYVNHRERFEKTARHWTNVYASGPTREPEMEEEVRALSTEMGLSEDEARIQISLKEFNPQAYA